MQKLNKLIILLAIMGFRLSMLQAQTTIINESFSTEASFNTFTTVNVNGLQNWYFSPYYGAVCSGYIAGQNYENEDWLISPAMNLSQADDATLTFTHTRGSAGVVNAGVTQGFYKAFATANYTGDPLTTQWVELDGLNQNITNAWQYVSSGELLIPSAARSESSRIAFRYISTMAACATWEIKNVKVTIDSPVTDPGSDVAFKITNWNTAMLAMDSDIYCIQEVSNTVSNPTIETLVSLMGNEYWGGTIVPSNTGDCNQRQGVIYKRSKVQFVTSMELSTGNASQGNTYRYNWSNGRYPALYNVNLIAGTTLIPVSIVNIHAKAEDGEAASYNRRLGASEGLKAILDGTTYNAKNMIVVGDFNDYLTGTTSNACNCTVSPYQNFMDDTSNYTGITEYITDVDTRFGIHPVIENIIISDELADNYVQNSAAQEVNLPQDISNYYYTTSNHLPVSATFQFSTLGNTDYAAVSKSFTIYPNPVKDVLNINFSSSVKDFTTEIYDLTGRQVFYDNSGRNTVNVSALPTGMYILKMGDNTGKFIKE
jgi:endonuclease/exonuclease/phosphatase family metal-dependent hydrolase